jgi:hypothetical protein
MLRLTDLTLTDLTLADRASARGSGRLILGY